MVASRTPEGLPNRCPICGNSFQIEPSHLTDDAPCPSCGQLLWWFQHSYGDVRESITVESVLVESAFADDLKADSLDIVELVMELEEEFDITIPDEAAEKIQTVGQAVEHIESHVKS